MILFINACVRGESRTKRLADYLISKTDDTVEETRVYELDFPRVDEDFLNKREEYIASADYSAPMFDLARQFARADRVIVAAPFWDLSFPAALKQYFEQVTVLGLTFVYNEEGIPQGLCKAKDLFYITTAGGPVISEAYGYGCIESLAKGFYGIKNTHLIKAENLDVLGADVEALLQEARSRIDEITAANE